MENEMDVRSSADPWWMLWLVAGVISVLIGIALIWWREESLSFVGFLIGLWILFAGIVRFLVSLFGGEREHRWLLAIVGIVGIAVGVVVMKNPTETIGVIAIIVGIFWLIFGLIDVFRGITNTALPDRWWAVLGGLIAVGAGVLLVFWTEPTVMVLALLAGIYLIIQGIIEITAAFRINSAMR
jgi:uncharacterized membrane protein HdeD (DUF308 family)